MSTDFGIVVAAIQLFIIPLLFVILFACAWMIKG